MPAVSASSPSIPSFTSPHHSPFQPSCSIKTAPVTIPVSKMPTPSSPYSTSLVTADTSPYLNPLTRTSRYLFQDSPPTSGSCSLDSIPGSPLPSPPLTVYSLSCLHVSDRHLLTQPTWTHYLPLPHYTAPTVLLFTISGNFILPVASPINCQGILGSSITATPVPPRLLLAPSSK